MAIWSKVFIGWSSRGWMANRPPELLAHYESIRRMLLVYLGDEWTADDLVQEVYYRALRSARPEGSWRDPGAWLRTVARNAARDYFRTRHEERPLPEDSASVVSDRSASPLEVVVSQEETDGLRESCLRLPGNDREVLLRYYVLGQSCPEIASDYGISVSGVKSRLARARGRLRIMMGEKAGSQ